MQDTTSETTTEVITSTGDNGTLMLAIAVGIVIVIAMIVAVVIFVKNRRNKE